MPINNPGTSWSGVAQSSVPLLFGFVRGERPVNCQRNLLYSLDPGVGS